MLTERDLRCFAETVAAVGRQSTVKVRIQRLFNDYFQSGCVARGKQAQV